MVTGDVACYRIDTSANVSGSTSSCYGTITKSGWNPQNPHLDRGVRGRGDAGFVTIVPGAPPTPITIVLLNESDEDGNLPYEIVAVLAGGTENSRIVKQNGLPPGTSVYGSRVASVG